ncbi:methyltransferase, FxLD system [Planomonospora sp. ID67723]|uniref:methyltransferase, FxLD system n=1 Tax=Planomonospora sp. ID67723 TaxID=2738134 RepID=UPI0018C35F4D|nr:methyltransferase, FxLD system [Planomonospora sp. ID67723]MBG0830779.1 methyltransferase, FxLD system [Planomonospora sp. ID67723]
MADLNALRESMVEEVRKRGVSDAVAQALRTVPRHVFLPEIAPEAAYRDDAIVTRRDADGLPISSSSQPTIMAVMLDQLGIEPGQRILEIGTGTGYNAALLALLAGPGGEVVSVDIDPDLVGHARRHLDAAGFPEVTVACADGFGGFPERAPYDRLIATVGVWDLAPAWLEQLGPSGRLVVPLDLRGVQRSVAMERADGHWASRSVVPCGFMRLRGPSAGPETTRILDRDSDLTISLPEAREVGDVLAVLDGPSSVLPTGISGSRMELLDGFVLWLAVHEPRWCSLFENRPGRLPSAPMDAPGYTMTAGIVERGGLGVLEYAGENGPLAVHAYGPEGAGLAADLAAHLRAWQEAGRPSSGSLRIEAHFGPAPSRSLVVDKRHTRLALRWASAGAAGEG